MRYVVGFFPPDRIFALVDALSEIHVHGMTVSDAQGFGQEHDAAHPEHQEHNAQSRQNNQLPHFRQHE